MGVVVRIKLVKCIACDMVVTFLDVASEPCPSGHMLDGRNCGWHKLFRELSDSKMHGNSCSVTMLLTALIATLMQAESV